MKDRIQKMAAGLLDDTISIRRHLHAHPELSGEESETARFISGKLTQWGIPHKTGIAGHGILGIIEGKKGAGKVIALRADMDALPIQEKNSLDFVSRNPGVMHACGHDVHMASLLGAAQIIKSLESELKGTVKLIFQPSEEKYPGGALPMIEAGVMENPRPDLVIGQHVFPEMVAGRIGLRPGHYMASTDEIHLTVTGKGGHAAIPHKVVDPVLIASHVVVALQQIVSRNARPTTPTVLSFGRFIAEGMANIIPDQVKLSGTMRTFDEQWRTEMKQKIRHLATTLAESMGGHCEVDIHQGYPAVYNNPDITARIKAYAVEYLGGENVEDLDMRMTAEDFSYFALETPGCFYRLGVMNDSLGITSNLHTATFNADEQSLAAGMGFMAWIVWNELN